MTPHLQGTRVAHGITRRSFVQYLLVVQAVLLLLSSCRTTYSTRSSGSQDNLSLVVHKVWTHSQSHPEGFTLDVRSMTEPTQGISVAYAATQKSHSREHLHGVVSHALQHDGYVGGWFNTDDSLYYFDSTRLLPEDSLAAALRFAQENQQYAVYILSHNTEIPLNGKVAQIVRRDTLLVGTTGDYRPLSFLENGTYWGFGIEVAQAIAHDLGVEIKFVATSWPTLTADVQAQPQTFDMAIGGITITDARRATMLMSDGYLANGKTILCRATDAHRFQSLADIDRPEVRVMVNPGGLNEQFALEHLTHATLIVHPRNEEIPTLVAQGQADVMITEITEAPYYVRTDTRLAAPLLSQPFTHGEIGVLMRSGQEDLLQMVNHTLHRMKTDGTLRRLHEKYGLVYGY